MLNPGTLTCGTHPGSPVTGDYASPFKLTGAIHRVAVDVSAELIRSIIAGRRLEAGLGLGTGQFLARPREVGGVLNEPFAAAIIYPAVIAAWTFLAAYSHPASRVELAVWVFALGFTIILGYNFWLKWGDGLKKWWRARRSAEKPPRRSGQSRASAKMTTRY